MNARATTEIYTLSLHDALPIYLVVVDDAVLENLDERRAVVIVGAFEDNRQMLLHGIHGAGDKPGAGSKRQGGGGNRIFNRPQRRRR